MNRHLRAPIAEPAITGAEVEPTLLAVSRPIPGMLARASIGGSK